MWAWMFLIGAGLIEIGWAFSLKLTNGYQHLGYLALNVTIGLIGSYFLAQAMRNIPMTTAYPIWKGIAIGGLVLIDVLLDKKPMEISKIFFIIMIVVGIVGLKAFPESA